MTPVAKTLSVKRKRTRGPKAAGGIRWTLLKAAQESGVTRETIRRGLRRDGIEPGPDGCYSTRQILQAVHGDLEAERIRETRARAELLEMEAAEKRRTLVSMEEVAKIYANALVPIRQHLNALPSECATRANPADPTHARNALAEWVAGVLPKIREAIH